MTDLSPSAQAVFWEFNRAASGKPDDWHYLPAIAAALRAAVEQVMPEEPEHAYAEDYELGVFDARLDARNHLLSIAAELEAHPD